ncbi:MAG: tetratricopeptide repeat protein, partial [Bradymonadaceae bacterium]
MASDPIRNADWRELLDALPESEAEILRRIDDLIEAGARDRALEQLEAALSRSPTDRLRIAYGRLALDEHRYEAARRTLEPASRGEAPPLDAHLLLAEACLGARAAEAAGRALARAEHDGASGGRYVILERRVDSALSDADGGGDPPDEDPLDSTVDATLGDLIAASAEAGEFEHPDTPDSRKPTSDSGENPFA